jgi:hypothetical protein
MAEVAPSAASTVPQIAADAGIAMCCDNFA